MPDSRNYLPGQASEEEAGSAFRKTGRHVTSDIRLSFPQVKDALKTARETSTLDRLHARLEDDYNILTDLFREAAGYDSVKHGLLVIDYNTMQVWYKSTRTHGDLALARNALAEMCSILSFLVKELEPLRRLDRFPPERMTLKLRACSVLLAAWRVVTLKVRGHRLENRNFS